MKYSVKVCLSLFSINLVSACATGIDFGSYPKNWPSAKTEGGRCDSVYGVYGPAKDEDSDAQFRVIASRLLRDETTIKNISALRIAAGSDPEFLEVTGYGKDSVLETSPIRVVCKDGIVALWPNKSEKTSSQNSFMFVNGNNIRTVAVTETVRRANWQSHFYLAGKQDVVVAEPTKECVKRLAMGQELDSSCRELTRWYRMTRTQAPSIR